MAGAGYKLFQTGDVLTAAQVNTYLNEQTVMVFANAAARTSALTSVLAEGMMSYLQDTNSVEVYNGSSWVNVGNAGDITEVQAGTGISVASGTGPIPVITNTVATAFDAAGDLVYGTGADTFTKLSLGTAGKVLTVNSGATAPEWATPSTGALTLLKKETFSAVSSVSIGSNASPLFSSTYDNYYINFIGTASGNAGLFFRVRANTTDASTNYTRQEFKVVNTTQYSGSASSQTSGYFGNVLTTHSANDLYLYSVFLAKPTLAWCNQSGAAGDEIAIQNTRHTDSTSYNGITVLPSSGTITGTLLIYGYGQ
jgi:hypothetical protein